MNLYLNTDQEGNIINSVAGEAVVPNVEYGFCFQVDSMDIPMNIHKYKVTDNKLVLKNL
ncbi:hypothetical protein [Bacillus mycoides]|uniref:hypothetical protein n=1 Tax=Bacillus mycoides TaxID=1405 RepID=UPI0004B12480|nr:hypothetical protein [Bacillus mycoides]